MLCFYCEDYGCCEYYGNAPVFLVLLSFAPGCLVLLSFALDGVMGVKGLRGLS